MGEPRDVKEFEFRGLRNIQIFQSSEFNNCAAVKNALSLQFVACANRYGLVFVLTPKKQLICLASAEIDQITRSRETANVPITNFPSKSVVDLESAICGEIDNPTFLSVNADESTLAVGVAKGNTPFMVMFDIRAFSDENSGNPVRPFVEVRLTATDGAKLVDFQWNPAVSELFCAAYGSLMTAQLKADGKGFQVLGSSGFRNSVPTCLCWSPKGKQVVVGKSDGTLAQYKQNLELAKNIAAPNGASVSSDKSVAKDGTICIKVNWLSTSQFVVLYAPTSKPTDVSLCTLTLSKAPNSPQVWTQFEDICYGYGQNLRPAYFMHHIPAWQMLVCTSTVATETTILGSPDKGVQDAALWVPWTLDDTARAELPTALGSSSPHALGSTVAYCSQKTMDLSDGSAITGAPLLLLVSTDGLLCPYWMVNRLPLATGLSLSVKPVFLTVNGMRDPLAPPPVAKPVSKPVIPAAQPPPQASLASGPALTKPVFSFQKPDPPPVVPVSQPAIQPVISDPKPKLENDVVDGNNKSVGGLAEVQGH